jgi:TIR domain-containing protein/HEAT repeat protein
MAWRVFYSYSHRDAELRDRLGTYLAPLKFQNKIEEWHDRKIEPGADWGQEISAQLASANLILLLASADFLASDYCFGIEVETALARLKRGEVKVVPVLLKPCLWEESRFSELQIIPRDAKPVTSWPSVEEAFTQVATEIRQLVSEPPPSPPEPPAEGHEAPRLDSSLELVREQILAYAHLYEKTRQRQRASGERTIRMEQIFQKMRSLAAASYPLLDELAASPSPGERLAAVSILQVFASERFLPFLVKLVGSEKPFVGFHAAKALHLAVGSLDPQAYPRLMQAIDEALAALGEVRPGTDTDRYNQLQGAKQELQVIMDSLSAPSGTYD